MNGIKNKKGLLLKLIVTALLVYVFSRLFDWGYILHITEKISLYETLVAMLLWIMTLFIATYRWHILANPIYPKAGFWFLFKLYFIGFFFNTFLPSSIGGDFYRVYRLNKRVSSKSQSIALVFVERVIGFFAIAFMASVSLFFTNIEKLDSIYHHLAFGSLFCFLIFFIFCFNDKMIWVISNLLKKISFMKMGERINQFYEKIQLYREYKFHLLMSFLVSIVYQLVVIFIFYFICLAMETRVEYTHLVIFVSLGSIVSLIPFSLGGLGYREFSYALMFRAIGLPAENGVALSLIVTVLTSLVNSMGGILYITEKNSKKS
ncbi:MAG: flippase-like domain-containing protein [Candidatus Delongbacteria bacterium]|nr:flippase-like domain-containing protein [Candidatus Delongbacteria bacterium]